MNNRVVTVHLKWVPMRNKGAMIWVPGTLQGWPRALALLAEATEPKAQRSCRPCLGLPRGVASSRVSQPHAMCHTLGLAQGRGECAAVMHQRGWAGGRGE